MMEITQTQSYTQAPGFFRRLTLVDWVYAAVLMAAALFALARFGSYMDIYEKAILLLAAPTFTALGWHWKPVRWLIPLVALLALWAVSMYAGNLDLANKKF